MAMADAMTNHMLDEVVLVHEPSQRFLAPGFELCDGAESALRFANAGVAARIIGRHGCEPVYSALALREALAA